MSRSGKLYFLKQNANDTLADRRLRKLTWAETGIWYYLCNIALTQTDMPGCFVVDGDNLGITQIADLLTGYKNGRKGLHSRNKVATSKLITQHLLRKHVNGYYYIKRIVEDHELSEAMRKLGAKGNKRPPRDPPRDSAPQEIEVRNRYRRRSEPETLGKTLSRLLKRVKPGR